MSVSYRADIVVGLPYTEMEDFLHNRIDNGEDTYDIIESLDFKISGPYFDCPYEESLIGYVIDQTDDYSWKEFVLDKSLIEEMYDTFFAKTGLYPKTYMTTIGW